MLILEEGNLIIVLEMYFGSFLDSLLEIVPDYYTSYEISEILSEIRVWVGIGMV